MYLAFWVTVEYDFSKAGNNILVFYFQNASLTKTVT